MVRGQRTANDVLKVIRKLAREHNWSVVQLPKRGKGSHTIWSVVSSDGRELGRVALTGHTGAMSRTVTRSNEHALEPIFGEGWLDL